MAIRHPGSVLTLSAFVVGLAIPALAQIAPVPPALRGAIGEPGMFAELELAGGFGEEQVAVEAGGTFPADEIDFGCFGNINPEAPDITLDFTRPGPVLNIFVRSDADTALVVRAPDGTWLCDDDTLDLNPLVQIEFPASGRYRIWVGTLEAGFPEAVVVLTEGTPRDGVAPKAEAERGPPVTHDEVGLLPIAVPQTSRAHDLVAGIAEPLNELLGGMDLVLGVQRPVTVADDGTELRITLPGLTLAGRDAGRGLFGDVMVAVRPHADGRLEFAIDLPRAIEAVDQGRTLGGFRLGPSRVAGTWSRPLQTFTNLRIEIADALGFDMEGGRERAYASVRRFVLSRVLREGAGGVWSGAYELGVETLALTPVAENALRIGKLSVYGTIADVELAALAELNAAYGIDGTFGGADALELYDFGDYLDEAMGLMWGRYTAQLGIDNLFTRDGADEYRLGTLRLRAGADLTGDVATFEFGFDIADLDADFGNRLPREVLPRSVRLEAGVIDVPFKDFLAGIAFERATGAGATDAAGYVGEELLNAARPMLQVRELALKGDVLEITASGIVELAPDTAGHPRANFDATIGGLGRAIEIVRANRTRLANADDTLRQLIALQGVGRAEAVNGAVVHRYRIDVNAAGETRINGMTLDELRP